jgi:septum formation protein
MIILGSTSPRRKELMNKITSDFKIIAPLFNEEKLSKETKHYALEESFNKAQSLINQIDKDDCLICADTIVFYNNKIYGKPKNIEEAKKFIRELSEVTHEVISGYTILYHGCTIKKEVVSYVTFNKLNDEKINEYVKNVYVLDKAGAYSIQDDYKEHIIKSIDGSFDNVMGLPIEEIKEDLKSLELIK